jgi:hypothetical protein
MNVESASRVASSDSQRNPGRAFASAVALAMVAEHANAQTTSSNAVAGGVAHSGFLQVFERLDPMAMVLIVGAAIVLVLLIVRIWIMVRREQPIAVPAPARKRPTMGAMGGDTIDRPTLQGSTDWGHDQNKRAAQSREAVTVMGITAGLPSLDQAVTQWTISEVHNAAFISKQANEGMGKSPNMPASPYRTSFNPYYKGESPTSAIEVIEVADTLLQAELLVQLGDPKQAMTLLSNHIRETEKPGPAVWLMLLNLYQSTGRKSQYEALALGFGTLFNAAVPPWATSKEVMARDIESYPQVMLKLHTTWGKPAARPLIEGLLNDDRGGSRQGFTLTAYRDLLFLLEIVDELDKIVEEDEEREGIQRKLGRIG